MIGRLASLWSRKRAHFAACEYWVYLPGEKLAPQEMLVARMLKSSPFQVDGRRAVEPSHALLFSDIRLHMALATKAKNVHLFRPDLFAEQDELTSEMLASLAEANSFAKIRFLSNDPLADRRHLTFMPHLAEAVAYYGNSRLVFDAVCERLLSASDLRAMLERDPLATSPGFHLRTLWTPTLQGGRASTKGLIKIGLPELQTPESPNEHRALVCGVLEEVAERGWEQAELADTYRVTYFGGEFQVSVRQQRGGSATARILRVQGAP